MTLKSIQRCLVPLVLLLGASFANAQLNIGGSWSVTASNGRRSASQTLVIQQDGNKISGTFKGPRQSGTLDGSIAGNQIQFHVNAKHPLDYTGTISGDTMSGTLTGDGKRGEWTAKRTQP